MLFLRNKSSRQQATLSQRWIIFVDTNVDAIIHCRGLKVDVMLHNLHSPLFSHPLITTLLGRLWCLHRTCEKSMLWVFLLPWDLRQAALALPLPWCQHTRLCCTQINTVLHFSVLDLLLLTLSKMLYSVKTLSHPQHKFYVCPSLGKSRSLLFFQHTPFLIKEIWRKAMSTKLLWRKMTHQGCTGFMSSLF